MLGRKLASFRAQYPSHSEADQYENVGFIWLPTWCSPQLDLNAQTTNVMRLTQAVLLCNSSHIRICFLAMQAEQVPSPFHRPAANGQRRKRSNVKTCLLHTDLS